jgi:autotransporter-associated beta strand protein
MLVVFMCGPRPSFGGSATWKAAPSNGNWNRTANWDPATIPSRPRDTATFSTSSQTAIFLRSAITLGGAVFNSGASGYNFTVGGALSLDFMNTGVTNNSGVPQNFVCTTDSSGDVGLISFSRRTTAGESCIFTTEPGTVSAASGGLIHFNNSANAGRSTFVNHGASVAGAIGGETDFFDNTSAAEGIFTASAGTGLSGEGGKIVFFGSSAAATGNFEAEGGEIPGALGGSIYFQGTSTADSATITLDGGLADGFSGANMYIEESATAGNAFINVIGGQVAGTSNGATLNFLDSSTSGGTQIFLFEGSVAGAQPATLFFYDDSDAKLGIIRLFDGVLDVSPHNPGTVMIGCILGYYGNAYLGANNLELGGNNIAQVLEVAFHDGGSAGGIGGSITKVGTNDLYVEVASDFTGGITLNQGRLILDSSIGSASGPGPVVVNSGELDGYYSVDGPITVNDGGTLLPWQNAYGSFETTSTVRFASGSNYVWDLKTSSPESDLLSANGVTIDSGAVFRPIVHGARRMEAGLELVALNNTGPNAIAGAFDGFPEGGVVPLGPLNTAQVSYSGGDGNDFTLTVLP